MKKLLTKDLPRSEEEKLEEMKVLKEVYPEQNRRFEFLYGNLSILDSKASSLLTFNAIGLTALAVWLEYIPQNWFHFVLDFTFVLFLLSCALCLITVWVYWSPPEHFQKPDLQMQTLLAKRNQRTSLYRLAWLLSSVAVVVLTFASVFHGFGTLLKASGNCGELCEKIFSENK